MCSKTVNCESLYKCKCINSSVNRWHITDHGCRHLKCQGVDPGQSQVAACPDANLLIRTISLFSPLLKVPDDSKNIIFKLAILAISLNCLKINHALLNLLHLVW